MPNRSSTWTRPCLLASNIAAPFVLFSPASPWWLLASAAVAHGCLIYAVFAPYCTWLGPVVTRFVTDKKQLWLTIDDGPDGKNSITLAEEMARRGVRATFFVKGCLAAQQPEITQSILANGHTLANHTKTHPIRMFWSLFPRSLRAEIDGCNEVLQKANADSSGWFRAPLGFKPIFLHSELVKCKMRLIGWSVRSHDGLVCNPLNIQKRVVSQARPGDIILMHEGFPQSNDAVLRVVDSLLKQGFAFVIPSDEQLI